VQLDNDISDVKIDNIEVENIAPMTNKVELFAKKIENNNDPHELIFKNKYAIKNKNINHDNQVSYTQESNMESLKYIASSEINKQEVITESNIVGSNKDYLSLELDNEITNELKILNDNVFD
jgi:hypothetical protein